MSKKVHNLIIQHPNFYSLEPSVKTAYDLLDKIVCVLLYQHKLEHHPLPGAGCIHLPFIDIEEINRVYLCKFNGKQRTTGQLAIRMPKIGMYVFVQTGCV